MYKLGLTLTIIGIIIWPLLLVGVPLLIVGRNEERKNESSKIKIEIQDKSNPEV